MVIIARCFMQKEKKKGQLSIGRICKVIAESINIVTVTK